MGRKFHLGIESVIDVGTVTVSKTNQFSDTIKSDLCLISTKDIQSPRRSSI
jgi:hypothetical protein